MKVLNKLHIYERFWTCLCYDKFHNLEDYTICNDCLYELLPDLHCGHIINRVYTTKINCHNCDNEIGCPVCKPDDYIFNEKTLKYEKKNG